MNTSPIFGISCFALCCMAMVGLSAVAQDVKVVKPPGGGDPHFEFGLDKHTDEKGNRIPDFSSAGYMANAEAIPNAPVRLVVPPVDGDDGARIQAALDRVATMPPDQDGVRGAVLLEAGSYQVEQQLILEHSGVVLRGQGPHKGGTTIEATGTDRRVLIRILGEADRVMLGEPAEIPKYTPVGTIKIPLNGELQLAEDNRVIITRPSPESWIEATGMDRTWNAQRAPRAWKPGELDIYWDRGITHQTDSNLELDSPITMALDPNFGGATVQAYNWPGRVEQAGVENLCLTSVSDPNHPKDEEHSWVGVSVENARDCWVRRVNFIGFVGSAVSVWESASRITVSDCQSLAPVSEDGGWRRHTFFTQGQQTLFLRCYSEHGRRDFTTGHTAAGPNAFVHCDAREALSDSGPIGPWATGVLFDNVNIDGGGLRLSYQGSKLKFAGWTAANCLLWQCTAAEIDCYSPPTAENWAFGCWGGFEGDGVWDFFNEFVSPKSLLQGQVEARLGKLAGNRIGPGVVHPPGSTRPSVEAAQKMAANSNRSAPLLTEVIAAVIKANPLPTAPGGAPVMDNSMVPAANNIGLEHRKLLKLENGWLTIDGKLAVGGRTDAGPWWRGSIAPTRIAAGVSPSDKHAVTRFVPGRTGLGYTDDLTALANSLDDNGTVALDHHPPLWYDRRRDDHQRVRRLDGEVWPPFYEMPYARSGQGIAWDGLSKYDLTRPNRWYFDRLTELASEFEQRGMIVSVMHYMQHNILEAGGHWADYPWRSANNINNTDFPEPPPYAGDKRIFQAHLFYDVMHTTRADLHRRTVEMFLEELQENENVIHLLGEEYTGPGAFTEHWVRCAADWEKRTARNALIGLCTTKPEQDAILEDPELSPAIDLIDTRYWGLRAGIHLSPRQQGRRGGIDGNSQGNAREYRMKYPQKAIVQHRGGWEYVMAGGSLPSELKGADDALLAAIPRMLPTELIGDSPNAQCLAEPGQQYLVHFSKIAPLELDLTDTAESFAGQWILHSDGEAAEVSIQGGAEVSITPPGTGEALLWLQKTTE